eukprot:CAMPEP_0183351672 /NCGR_PEP_ID=MMETSP0164_2-20130417/26180_1 /TAXON_ID=221442 /ORGANISM="Coccolithus pelagicus ssp braarudi, Strain PLY182g" /LENGTH=254 /DNA_ID=CAMNT_0025523913 /DNA_START=81 /DNA_END=845 /DNA_ORIENTATION=+
MLKMSLSLVGLLVAGASAACMPMSELETRMPQWVGVVPYSHLVNKTWGYPTDCSGFISWALEAGDDVKAYEWSADAFSTPIDADALRYGDIVTHVWDHSLLNRCSGSGDDDDASGVVATSATSCPGGSCCGVGCAHDSDCSGFCHYCKNGLCTENGDEGALPSLYMSGHVIFFDRWDDANHTKYWAYESTEAENQTPACKAQKGPLTRSLCFNHHVKKKRSKTIDKWSKDKCKDSKYGTLAGGPRRLSASLLCG